MRSRRPALILLIVMIVMIGALNASDRDRSRTASRTSTPPAALDAAPERPGRTVEAALPSSKPVRARTGDTVVLRVRSERPDIAKILAVGARTSVGPDLPGVLRFVAGSPEQLDVNLELAGRRAGVVQVTRRPS